MRVWRIVLAGAAALALGGCQTVSAVDKEAWAKRPAVTVAGTGAFRRIELKTRLWVIQPLTLSLPSNARAVALYFPGSTGLFGSLGFDRPLLEAGIAYAGYAPPTDLPNGFADGGYRSRPEHVADVEAAIRWLRAETKLPVWLVGISMGSVSVAHVATRSTVPIAGVVFISSITGTTPSGNVPYGERKATDFPLASIRVPVLAVIHRKDGCASTPPEGGAAILAAATSAPAKEILRFDGGMETDNPCGGKSYHTFLGQRDAVGAAIAKFILAHGAAGR